MAFVIVERQKQMTNTNNYIYLFSGKCIKTNKWITGSLIGTGTKKYILKSKTTAYIPLNSTTFCSNSCYEVKPETVRQCTGFADSAKKLIFLSDIVEYEQEGKRVVCVVEMRNFTLYPFVKVSPQLVKVIGNTFDNPDLFFPKKGIKHGKLRL